MKDLSERENKRLRNEKRGVFQIITKFIAGVDGCKSNDDFDKCTSCLAAVNDTLNLQQICHHLIDSKWKIFYTEDHIPKPLANDGLLYCQEARERVEVLHEEFQKAPNKLTTTLKTWKGFFHLALGRICNRSGKKEKKGKVKILKEKTFTYLLFEKLT